MSPLKGISPFWQTVLETMTEGLMLVKAGGAIIFANRAMEAITGYAHEELVGRTCAVLEFDCCPSEIESKKHDLCPLFAGGHFAKSCSLTRKDGVGVTVLKNARALVDEEGHVYCAVEIKSDVAVVEEQQREIRDLRGMLEDRYGFQGIVGASPKMRTVFDIVKKAALSDAPVLIYGESGTGKGLVAKAIHKLGKKSKGPFIRVNCAALSESLLESELFGHVKGAFTGADRTTKGRFEAAHTGDIFLDEIGDISPSAQVRLLRVVEEQELERVGDYKSIPIDVRVIAATHRDLPAHIRKGLFREDLFFRLNVIPIYIPPLRERCSDIPLLVQHFIRETAARSGKRITAADPEAMDLLMRYTWPGNVRELINVIQYAFVVCSGDAVTRSDLPPASSGPCSAFSAAQDNQERKVDEERLTEALIAANGNRIAAARILGVSRQTVWSYIKKYGIDVELLRKQRE